MKFHVRTLKLGEVVTALVVDHLPGNEVLLDFNGDLIRVANQTQRPLRQGTQIQIRVTAIHPLQFQLIDRLAQRRSGHFDYSI